ncbi:UNVERIFIED_CONTAM: hypothetical protein K2H54_038129 [Gekko kuhli]
MEVPQPADFSPVDFSSAKDPKPFSTTMSPPEDLFEVLQDPSLDVLQSTMLDQVGNTFSTFGNETEPLITFKEDSISNFPEDNTVGRDCEHVGKDFLPSLLGTPLDIMSQQSVNFPQTSQFSQEIPMMAEKPLDLETVQMGETGPQSPMFNSPPELLKSLQSGRPFEFVKSPMTEDRMRLCESSESLYFPESSQISEKKKSGIHHFTAGSDSVGYKASRSPLGFDVNEDPVIDLTSDVSFQESSCRRIVIQKSTTTARKKERDLDEVLETDMGLAKSPRAKGSPSLCVESQTDTRTSYHQTRMIKQTKLQFSPEHTKGDGEGLQLLQDTVVQVETLHRVDSCQVTVYEVNAFEHAEHVECVEHVEHMDATEQLCATGHAYITTCMNEDEQSDQADEKHLQPSKISHQNTFHPLQEGQEVSPEKTFAQIEVEESAQNVRLDLSVLRSGPTHTYPSTFTSLLRTQFPAQPPTVNLESMEYTEKDKQQLIYFKNQFQGYLKQLDQALRQSGLHVATLNDLNSKIDSCLDSTYKQELVSNRDHEAGVVKAFDQKVDFLNEQVELLVSRLKKYKMDVVTLLSLPETFSKFGCPSKQKDLSRGNETTRKEKPIPSSSHDTAGSSPEVPPAKKPKLGKRLSVSESPGSRRLGRETRLAQDWAYLKCAPMS